MLFPLLKSHFTDTYIAGSVTSFGSSVRPSLIKPRNIALPHPWHLSL